MIPFRWRTGQSKINLWKEISEGQLYMSGEDWWEGVIRKVSGGDGLVLCSDYGDGYISEYVYQNSPICTHIVCAFAIYVNSTSMKKKCLNIEWIAFSVLSITFLVCVILYTEPPLMYEPMYHKPLQAS